MAERCRLLFLTVMPSPYQQQLFRALAADPGVEIEVVYYTATARDRAWQAPALASFERILSGRTLSRLWPSAHFNPGILRELKRVPDRLVVVSDYSALTAQVAMWYLTARRRTWVYWGEMPGMREGRLLRVVRGLLILPVRLGAAAVCAVGSIAAARYRSLLGPGRPVFNIPYFCDLEPFSQSRRANSGRVTLLYSGQFISRKGLDTLLDAFARLAPDVPQLDLLLVGGSEAPELLKRLPDALRHRVRFAGFVQTADLPQVYAQADLFVLPSRHDGWGVVVNEAVGAGLPVIVSDRVGAARDLVEHGVNGFVFQSGNVPELADCIRRLATSAELREAFSSASARLAERFGLQEGVQRWKAVCAQLSNRANA